MHPAITDLFNVSIDVHQVCEFVAEDTRRVRYANAAFAAVQEHDLINLRRPPVDLVDPIRLEFAAAALELIGTPEEPGSIEAYRIQILELYAVIQEASAVDGQENHPFVRSARFSLPYHEGHLRLVQEVVRETLALKKVAHALFFMQSN